MDRLLYIYIYIYIYIFLWLKSPNRAYARSLLRFLDRTQLDTHTHARTHAHTNTHTNKQPAGLLWTNDQHVAKAATLTHTTNKETNINALSGIRTLSRSDQAVTNLHRKPHGHWDRSIPLYTGMYLFFCYLTTCFSSNNGHQEYEFRCQRWEWLVQISIVCVYFDKPAEHILPLWISDCHLITFEPSKSQ